MLMDFYGTYRWLDLVLIKEVHAIIDDLLEVGDVVSVLTALDAVGICDGIMHGHYSVRLLQSGAGKLSIRFLKSAHFLFIAIEMSFHHFYMSKKKIYLQTSEITTKHVSAHELA